MLHPISIAAHKQDILIDISRIAYINDNGMCIIGMERIALLPLIFIDAVVNVSFLCVDLFISLSAHAY